MSAITIIGAAGAIGAAITTELVRRGGVEDLHLVDLRTNVLEADRIDLIESAVAADQRPPRVTVHDPHSAARADVPSDVVVCAATLGERPGQSRSSFAAMNWELLSSLGALIRHAAGDSGAVVLVTNPIDVMASRLAREQVIDDPQRITGYCMNDSTRMRVAVARQLGVEPHRVGAQALGLHGEVLVPMFSGVTLDGRRVELSDPQRAAVREELDTWFARWHSLESGRSSTRSTAVGVSLIVDTALRGGEALASASTNALPGLPDSVFIGLPVEFVDGRARARIPVHASDEEMAGLKAAAQRVLEMTDDLA